MIATSDIERIIGAEVVDPDNDRIGKVSQVYVDADTDQPTWASVRTGLFGLSESLVPLDNASWDDETLHVGVQKARVKDAPRVDPEAEISPDEQERLYRYYGLADGAVPTGAEGADADETVTVSDTGYGAGPGVAGAAAGMAGAGLQDATGRPAPERLGGTAGGAGSPSEYGDGPAGPRYDRGQSAEADAPRAVETDAGYGEVADEPAGPDVRGSGRTAGDGRGSGDFASTGTALAEENPVAEEAAVGTGSGYGTSDVEDISGRFLEGDTGAEMREAGATPTRADAEEIDQQEPLGGEGLPGMAGGIADAGTDLSPGTPGAVQGGMRLRRYVVRQETVMVPVDEAGEPLLEPRGTAEGDSSVGMRMDDQDPTDPGRR
ncbi:MAG: PRC-barrel domain-containing protein [Amnibacterium sp.]